MCHYRIFFIIIGKVVIIACKPVKICITVKHTVIEINRSVLTVRISTEFAEIILYFICLGFFTEAFYVGNSITFFITDEISRRTGVFVYSLFTYKVLLIKLFIGGIKAVYRNRGYQLIFKFIPVYRKGIVATVVFLYHISVFIANMSCFSIIKHIVIFYVFKFLQNRNWKNGFSYYSSSLEVIIGARSNTAHSVCHLKRTKLSY